MNAVTIPVMAKTRIGHFAEAQILEALGVDMVDESEGKPITFYLESASYNCNGGFHLLFFHHKCEDFDVNTLSDASTIDSQISV